MLAFQIKLQWMKVKVEPQPGVRITKIPRPCTETVSELFLIQKNICFVL